MNWMFFPVLIVESNFILKLNAIHIFHLVDISIPCKFSLSNAKQGEKKSYEIIDA